MRTAVGQRNLIDDTLTTRVISVSNDLEERKRMDACWLTLPHLARPNPQQELSSLSLGRRRGR